jgi:hypothetical protein
VISWHSAPLFTRRMIASLVPIAAQNAYPRSVAIANPLGIHTLRQDRSWEGSPAFLDLAKALREAWTRPAKDSGMVQPERQLPAPQRFVCRNIRSSRPVKLWLEARFCERVRTMSCFGDVNGEVQEESASNAGRAFDPDVPAVFAHDFLTDSQAQAGAARTFF